MRPKNPWTRACSPSAPQESPKPRSGLALRSPSLLLSGSWLAVPELPKTRFALCVPPKTPSQDPGLHCAPQDSLDPRLHCSPQDSWDPGLRSAPPPSPRLTGPGLTLCASPLQRLLDPELHYAPQDSLDLVLLSAPPKTPGTRACSPIQVPPKTPRT